MNGYFVKFNDYVSLRPIHDALQYMSLADRDPNAPRVPKILSFFHRDHMMTYLVMEYVEHTCIPNSDLAQRVAEALKWLRSLPVPEGASIGPLGNGQACHILFKDYRAPMSFTSIEALERFMNKVCKFNVHAFVAFSRGFAIR